MTPPHATATDRPAEPLCPLMRPVHPSLLPSPCGILLIAIFVLATRQSSVRVGTGSASVSGMAERRHSLICGEQMRVRFLYRSVSSPEQSHTGVVFASNTSHSPRQVLCVYFLNCRAEFPHACLELQQKAEPLFFFFFSNRARCSCSRKRTVKGLPGQASQNVCFTCLVALPVDLYV